MRVVVAKVLAAAANAVLVAQHHFQLGAHLTAALARLFEDRRCFWLCCGATTSGRICCCI
jgi:hypothetical protein